MLHIFYDVLAFFFIITDFPVTNLFATIIIRKEELYMHGKTGKVTKFIGIQDSSLVYYNV